VSPYFDLKKKSQTPVLLLWVCKLIMITCVNLNNRIEICMLSLRMDCKEIHFIAVQDCCFIYHISRYGLTGRDCRVMHKVCQ